MPYICGFTDFELVGMIGEDDGEDVEEESVLLPFLDDVVDIQSAVRRRHSGVTTALDPTFQAPRHLRNGTTTPTPLDRTTQNRCAITIARPYHATEPCDDNNNAQRGFRSCDYTACESGNCSDGFNQVRMFVCKFDSAVGPLVRPKMNRITQVSFNVLAGLPLKVGKQQRLSKNITELTNVQRRKS